VNQVIIVIIAALSAIAACVTAAASLRASLRNHDALKEIHILVNNRLDRVLQRVDQLTQTLEHADVVVPPDPADAPGQQR
jgi:hypothetical protein